MYGATVLTNRIVAIEQDERLHYTFTIDAPNAEGKFYNFILTTTMEGEILRDDLLEYDPSPEWILDITKPFDGFIRKIDRDSFSSDKSSNLKSSISESCVAGATGKWKCNWNKPHAPGTPNTSCTSWTYIITVTYEPCPATEDQDPYPIDNGDNGDDGGGGSSGGPSIGTTPTVPCEDGEAQEVDDNGNCYGEPVDEEPIVIPAKEVFYYLGTSSAEYIWIMDSLNFRDLEEIAEFLVVNNHSDEAQNFAREAIKAKMNLGEVDIDARLIYNPLTANQIKARMSPSEAVIFENLNIIQQSLYLKAATEAYTYAEIFYPRPVRNRKGDAIKHSLWNALSTGYLGSSLTKQLTDAHENITYDYPNHYKETEMDFHNNAVGRQLAQSVGFVFYLVENALSQGDLRYLNSLEFSSSCSCYRATNNSQLIPTNQ